METANEKFLKKFMESMEETEGMPSGSLNKAFKLVKDAVYCF